MSNFLEVKALVYHDGSVVWVRPVNYFIRCLEAGNGVTNCSLQSVVFFLILRF